MGNSNEKFKEAIKKIDEANSEDPHREIYNGQEISKELLYSFRMSEWLHKMNPNASEPLKLAARSQHIQRWKIARDEYPMDRKGYNMWRFTLKKFHADKAETILTEVGYDQHVIKRVKALISKEKLKIDPEAQLLEDVVCLVFLQYYFSSFLKKHEEDKLVKIIRKTWSKMSPAGHKEALQLDFGPEEARIINKALNED
jgi:hypothetical protein